MKNTVLDTLGSGIHGHLAKDGEVPVMVAPVPHERLLDTLDPELQARIIERDALVEPEPATDPPEQ